MIILGKIGVSVYLHIKNINQNSVDWPQLPFGDWIRNPQLQFFDLLSTYILVLIGKGRFVIINPPSQDLVGGFSISFLFVVKPKYIKSTRLDCYKNPLFVLNVRAKFTNRESYSVPRFVITLYRMRLLSVRSVQYDKHVDVVGWSTVISIVFVRRVVFSAFCRHCRSDTVAFGLVPTYKI